MEGLERLDSRQEAPLTSVEAVAHFVLEQAQITQKDLTSNASEEVRLSLLSGQLPTIETMDGALDEAKRLGKFEAYNELRKRLPEKD